ncbi:histone-lysine N-methyltransferase SETMAR [Trichonephila clavipes]|nr:histone-lysine N-methyltransferase SETMAR [Trichonephila clavipes]
MAEIANGVYGADTVTDNYVQFWFQPFRSGIFDVKDAPRTGRPVIKNVDKITEIIQVDRHVSSCCPLPTQELKIDHNTVLNHMRKVGLKNQLDGHTLNSDVCCQRLDRLTRNGQNWPTEEGCYVPSGQR